MSDGMDLYLISQNLKTGECFGSIKIRKVELACMHENGYSGTDLLGGPKSYELRDYIRKISKSWGVTLVKNNEYKCYTMCKPASDREVKNKINESLYKR